MLFARRMPDVIGSAVGPDRPLAIFDRLERFDEALRQGPEVSSFWLQVDGRYDSF